MQTQHELSEHAFGMRTYSSKRLGFVHKTQSIFQRARHFFKKRLSVAHIQQQDLTPESDRYESNSVPTRARGEIKIHTLRRKAISFSGSLGLNRQTAAATFDYNFELWRARHKSTALSSPSEANPDRGNLHVPLPNPFNRRSFSAQDGEGAPRLPPLSPTTRFGMDAQDIPSLEGLFSNEDAPLASNKTPREAEERPNQGSRMLLLSSVDDMYDTPVSASSVGRYCDAGSDTDSVCRTPTSKKGSIDEILWGSRDLPVRKGAGSLKKVLKPLHQLKEYASKRSLRLRVSENDTGMAEQPPHYLATLAAIHNSNENAAVEKSRLSEEKCPQVTKSQNTPRKPRHEDSALSTVESICHPYYPSAKGGSKSKLERLAEHESIRLVGEPTQHLSSQSDSAAIDSKNAGGNVSHFSANISKHFIGLNNFYAETGIVPTIHEPPTENIPPTSRDTSEWSNAGTDELPNWHSYCCSHPPVHQARLLATNVGAAPQKSASGQSQSPSLD